MVCFQQWLIKYQGISNIVMFGLLVVAIFPILKEWRHKYRYRNILREMILIEIRDIHESYNGKIGSFKKNWEKDESLTVEVPDHDKDFFKRLAESFKETTYLTKIERKQIGKLIRTFRKGSYHKRPGTQINVIDKDSIFEIEKLSRSIIIHIESHIN